MIGEWESVPCQWIPYIKEITQWWTLVELVYVILTVTVIYMVRPFNTDLFSYHWQFKVRLHVVEKNEWYSQSISVYMYIIYPSKGLRYMTQVPWYVHAPCVISRLSA